MMVKFMIIYITFPQNYINFAKTGLVLKKKIHIITEQEDCMLWHKEPPRDATFAHTPIVFRTKFGDVPLELDR